MLDRALTGGRLLRERGGGLRVIDLLQDTAGERPAVAYGDDNLPRYKVVLEVVEDPVAELVGLGGRVVRDAQGGGLEELREVVWLRLARRGSGRCRRRRRRGRRLLFRGRRLRVAAGRADEATKGAKVRKGGRLRRG